MTGIGQDNPIDWFHISTRAYQLQTYGTDYDFRWLERRLDGLGFHLVFCTRTPQSFEQARAERLNESCSINPRIRCSMHASGKKRRMK